MGRLERIEKKVVCNSGDPKVTKPGDYSYEIVLSKIRMMKDNPFTQPKHKAVFFFLAETQWSELTKGNLAFVWLSSVALMRIPHTDSILTGCFKA